ncbi:MAG: FliH/SctL family protein [Thermoanaerobacteraceae bacterium]|nr:FliH/SctL family protein [Thermoanaerobacteraceae bacterium]
MSKVFKENQIVIADGYNLAVLPLYVQKPAEKISKTVDSEDLHIDLKKQYEDFMIKMEKEKKDILEMANQEAAKIKEAAYKEGKLQGYIDGKKEATLSFEKKLEEINSIKDEIIKEKSHLCETLEEDIINLVIKICEKVFYEDATNLQESISKRVIEALRELNNTKDINIRVNYEDIEHLSILREQFKEKINIIPEYKLSKGDFIIETPNGLIDYSMVNIVKNIRSTLIEVLRNDRTG